jgi:hypothetical protein
MANMQRNELSSWLILLLRKLVNRKRRFPVVTALRGIQEQEHATDHRSVGICLECTEAKIRFGRLGKLRAVWGTLAVRSCAARRYKS